MVDHLESSRTRPEWEEESEERKRRKKPLEWTRGEEKV